MKQFLRINFMLFAALLTLGIPLSLKAQTTWTSRNSAQNNQWKSVAYGNGLFVAVSYDGTNRVMTSPDGINWTARTAAQQNEWTSVTFGGGQFVAVGESGTHRVMTSPDGITWTSRTAPAHWWKSVTYGDGTFVAVSDNGSGNRVMTSTDGGITWTSRTSAKDYWWNSVTFGNGIFVAVAGNGEGDMVMTSPNGIDWTIRNSVTNNVWKAVTFGNGRFVAVAESGSGNRAMSSTDGINWVAGTATPDLWWKAVTYGNGTFVAVADNGSGNRVMTSTNGTDWTARTSAKDYWWNSVTFANGMFVAVAGNGSGDGVMTSGIFINTAAQLAVTNNSATLGGNVTGEGITERGIVWATTTNPTTSNNKVQIGSGTGTFSQNITGLPANTRIYVRAYATNAAGTAYGNEISFTTLAALASLSTANPFNIDANFASLGGNISNSGGTSVTERGIVWAATPNPTTSDNKVQMGSGTGSFSQVVSGLPAKTLIYVKAYAISAGGTAYGNEISFTTLFSCPASTTAWTSRAAVESDGWSSVTYGNGLFVAVYHSGSNRVMTSPDGINWTARNAAQQNGWSSVTYGNGLFVAVANNGSSRVMTSPNGINWTSRTTTGHYEWNSVTYGNGLFVAVAYSMVMTSPDGITWTNRDVSGASLQSVTYGNGLFVAVASLGSTKIITSPNGITWTSRTNPSDSYWNSVTYGNGLFVAVATYGDLRIMTSSNGTSWTPQFAAENSWQSVAYGNGLFVAVAGNGNNRVMTSPDGSNWTSQNATEDSWWRSVTYGNGLFVAVASLGNNIRVMTRPAKGIIQGPILAESAVVSYLWRGNTYTTSGIYQDTLANVSGCDSVLTLNLTITNLPSLSTATVSGITVTSAILGGNISDDGGATVAERGIVWAVTTNPTTSNNKVQIGSGTGSFSQTVSGFPANTLIYVRAYATNAAGTAYGNAVSFTLANLATLSTTAATSISPTSAILGGNITADGGANVTERGIVWATSTNPNPTTANNKVQIGSGTGSFSQTLSGLSPGSTIYVRAYAINVAGTAYGNQISFTTQVIGLPPVYPPMPPVIILATLSTTAATNITATSATLGGNVTANGITSVTERGIVWATSANPTTANNKVQIGSGTGSFSQNITGLPLGTLIYVRAYAINSAGTAYGDGVSFTTQNTLPVTLLSYTAKAENNHALLQWQTASETNNKGFEIWRKAEGLESGGQEGLGFVKIGEVSASQISNLMSQIYSYTDKHPLNGTNYYKLIQVDNDGTTTELGVRTVTFNLQLSTFHLYPNPTTNQVTVSFPMAKYNTLTIADIIGKQLQRIAINDTENSKEVSLAAYPTGVYIVQLSGNQQTVNKRIIKK